MDLRAILLTAFAMPFAGVVALAFINRNAMRNAADDAGEQHPEPLFIGGGEILTHTQLATEAKDAKHV